jgi:RNA polymerase sigma factor (sigma-70 family)
MATPDSVLNLATEMTALGADWQLHAYGNTQHAFTNPAANDPARGTAFSTYAWVAICRRIHRRAKELRQDTDVLVAEMPASWVLPDPAEEMERKLIEAALREQVGQLPERLGQVVVGRYGLGEQPPCTLKELGKEMGLSGERVRQLEQDALAWLRQPVHSGRLRQLLGKNTAADYRHALALNAALRRARRQ